MRHLRQCDGRLHFPKSPVMPVAQAGRSQCPFISRGEASIAPSMRASSKSLISMLVCTGHVRRSGKDAVCTPCAVAGVFGAAPMLRMAALRPHFSLSAWLGVPQELPFCFGKYAVLSRAFIMQSR